jgi:hypothetical protein
VYDVQAIDGFQEENCIIGKVLTVNGRGLLYFAIQG